MFTEHQTISKRKNTNKKLIIGGVIVGSLCMLLLVFITYAQNAVTSPNSNDSSTTHLTISQGEGSGDIATKLRDADLLRDRFIFILYLNYIKAGDNLQAGEYDIPRNLNMIQMAEFLSHGKNIENKVTFPEGWTLEKMADRLAANGIVTKADFLAATKKQYNYDFLVGKPATVDLEGFLYPDTYVFEEDATADDIVSKMLENFDKKLATELKSKVASTGLSLYEVVTLASIVEREVSKADDRQLVASVFLNRLEIGMPLESCATIQYITGESKKQFTYEETRTPSPYNTYIYKGLPPGPIGNPSIDSIRAVLEPRASDYLYFLSSDGQTYFSKTFEEHEAKKVKYLN